jgi:hypothetical protein
MPPSIHTLILVNQMADNVFIDKESGDRCTECVKVYEFPSLLLDFIGSPPPHIHSIHFIRWDADLISKTLLKGTGGNVHSIAMTGRPMMTQDGVNALAGVVSRLRAFEYWDNKKGGTVRSPETLDWSPVSRAISSSLTLEVLSLCGKQSPEGMFPTSIPPSLRHYHVKSWEFGRRPKPSYVEFLSEDAPWPANLCELTIPMEWITMDYAYTRLRTVKRLNVFGRHYPLDLLCQQLFQEENQVESFSATPQLACDAFTEILQMRHCLVTTFNFRSLTGINDTNLNSKVSELCRLIRRQTRIRQFSGILFRSHKFEKALRSEEFQVMQVLLSLRVVLRLTVPGSTLAKVPWADHLERVSETLGWSQTLDALRKPRG